MTPSRLLLAALSAVLLAAGCGGGSGSAGATAGGLGTFAPTSNILPQSEAGVPYAQFSAPLSQTAIAERRMVTVRDAEAWNRLWAEHAGPGLVHRPTPEVDFSKKMVIGMFFGAGSACDSFGIDTVKRKDGPPRIEVAWKQAPPPEVCAAAVVNHAVLITVPASALPVEFVPAQEAASDLVVRSGWSFGFCLDKCEGKAEIRQDSATLRVTDGKQSTQQERAVWGAVTRQEWETLLATFDTLPDVTVGCPDCADEGREWIEVEHKGSRKRLDMSCGVAVPEASRLQETVRVIRARLSVALGLPEFCNPGSIAFERIAPSLFSSEIAEKRFVAIRDAAAWTALWHEHSAGRAPLPAVDFSQQMVAGVFMGGESIPCGSTSIESVRRRSNPDRIEVGYRVLDPGPVACIAAVINQYALVTLPTSPLPVEFVRLPSP